MRRVIFLAAVEADLLAVLEHVADVTSNVAIAEFFVGELRDKCRKLASLGVTLGRPRPELGMDIRSFPFKNYVIFFRYAADRFEVITILHGHRDIEAAFADPPKPAS